MRALVVVHRDRVADELIAALGELEIAAVSVSDVTEALRRMAADGYELIVGGWWQTNDEGLGLCRAIKNQFPDRRIVMLLVTDRSTPEELRYVLEAGADDYIHWPIDPAELRIRLRIAARRASDRAERRRVEQQLRESIERFELAARGTNDGLWDAQPMGEPWHKPDAKVWYSPRLKELLGFTDAELPNVLESWESRLHPDDYQRVMQALGNHMTRRVPYDVEYRLRTKSGEYHWFSARGQAVWDEQGNVMRMAGSLRDITQRKEYEARLEQSEEKWRSLVENAPEIIVLADLDGTIRFVNRTLPLAQESIGRSVYDYVDAEYRESTRQAFEAVVATGKPQSYEVQSQTVGGGMAWYATRVGPIWHEGRIASVVLVATNITLRKLAEEQLQSERNLLRRLLELQERERQLAAYEIHDGLVQYLTAGLMHLEASAGTLELMPPETRTEYERAIGLLREALAEGRRLISGLRPPILDEQGVAAALEYLINEARQDIPGLEFVNHTHFGRLAPPVEVAIFRITQEALSNIRKHSGAQRARVELVQHGEWVRLIVRDWGAGFDPATVQEDRFGLQGIRQRARLLGTRAVIESVSHQGATVVVDFPLLGSQPTT